MTVHEVERPQVYLNDQQELEALLFSIAETSGQRDAMIIRPVNRFTPAN